ncbi:MAG TPA: AmmeMemoRadiSam system radical SAM enzyme [Candidatus Polarisedimenticolaceae bacterium]|nr:AmmeMemoRadiSam system radical SAM enzyme [Candidatus Polarisedimenticolaceae bacterium]
MARRLVPEMVSVAEALEQRTATAAPALALTLPERRVRCLACAHRCVVLPGLDGICRVRSNREGTLRVPRGYVAALQIDPIEKKPFFHALPGASVLSFGMLGCDLHCAYCQNWVTSQTLRDPAASGGPRDVGADDLVAAAEARGCPVLVSTYNEPLITAEWAAEVFSAAKAAGLVCGFVSNGHATPEVLAYLRPHLDLYKVDLKGFRNEHYRDLGGRIAPVLDTIRSLKESGIWLEIVTLLIPGVNDDPAEIADLTSFLASVSPDIPWHVTAFHPDYKMTGTRATTASDLLRAAETGRAAGLRFVYAGNLPGAVGTHEDTRCPSCGATLVARRGYAVEVRALTPGGACAACGSSIAGYWQGRAA